MYKYARTWQAIDDAISKSHGLKQYPTISRLVGFMREFPHNVDYIDWNLVVCAGYEMDDDLKAPIWNGVLDVWNVEKREVALEQGKSTPRVARVT